MKLKSILIPVCAIGIALTVYGFMQNDRKNSPEKIRITYTAIAYPITYTNENGITKESLERLERLEKRLADDVKDAKITFFMENKSFVAIYSEDEVSVSQGPTESSSAVSAGYYDFASGNDEKVMTTGIGDNFNLLVSPKDLFEYTITNETKEILGFKCYKAIPRWKDSKYAKLVDIPDYVYFTTSLPYVGGPTLATNLPGVILEVKSFTSLITAQSIEKYDGNLPKHNKKKQTLDMEGLRKYYNNFQERIGAGN